MEKIKETIHKVTAPKGTTHDTTTHGTHAHGTHGTSTNAGPHSSNMANSADPRVDSDLDGRSGLGGQHGHQTGGLTGTSHQTGYGGPTTAGPHNSDLMNKADPRIDSDMSKQGYGHNSGVTGSHSAHTGTGTGGYGSTTSTTAGPHSSNLANKMDPRVDSDRDGQGKLQSSVPGSTGHTTGGYGHDSGVTGTHNTHSTGGVYGGSSTTTAGPHSSNLANKMDPRVDSDRDGQGKLQSSVPGSTGHTTSTGYGHTGTGNEYSTPGNAVYGDQTAPHQHGLTGSNQHGGLQHSTGTHDTTGDVARDGPAPHTAGPHKSDMMNKLDPRVDSDHSKTHGHTQQY